MIQTRKPTKVRLLERDMWIVDRITRNLRRAGILEAQETAGPTRIVRDALLIYDDYAASLPSQ